MSHEKLALICYTAALDILYSRETLKDNSYSENSIVSISGQTATSAQLYYPTITVMV